KYFMKRRKGGTRKNARHFSRSVGNPRRGFPDEKGSYFYIKDGAIRHGGAAQTAPFFTPVSGGTVFRFIENINHSWVSTQVNYY
ncbi:MAG: hypothetical protein PUB43_09545, partial [Oscillospiraceae bacterium]|nr:hypothetical protein [Oscillospiraceae bacterium]